MMRSSVYHVLEKMDELERDMDRYDDKSYEKYQAGNLKSSEYYEKKADMTKCEIEGMKAAMKILGFGVWKDNTGHYHIPLDDIETLC